MPFYCYTSKRGETVERVFPMGEAPGSIEEEVYPDDEESGVIFELYERDRAAEWAGGPKSGEKGAWPIECYASGVNAAQAPELRKFFKDRHFDCEVTNDGDPVYRNPQHRTKALKMRGLHDESSFGTET